MKCPICGKEIDDAAKYCLGCGGKIPRCPTCNKVLGRTETFCTYDGTRIPEEVLAVYSTQRQQESTGADNLNTDSKAAASVYNNTNKNAAPKPPKSKIPVWIIIVLAVFMTSSAVLGAVVIKNMLLADTSDKAEKKHAKADDDDETKSKKSKKKKSKKGSTEESAEESAEEAQDEDEVMASLDADAKQSVGNQVPTYATPQATDMVPVTLPPQTPPQTPPPTTMAYYYPDYSDGWDMLDYFIYNSDSMYFTEADIAGFDARMCRLARNGIYAKLGRKFKDAELSNFFSQYYWYYPTIEAENFSDRLLNAYQVANRDLIVSYERKHGFNQ